MVTLIKVEKEVGTFKAFKIFGDFEDYNETNLFDRMLSKDSECDKYEYLYVFLQNHEVESLKKIIVENGLVIFDVLDFIVVYFGLYVSPPYRGVCKKHI